MARSPVFGKWTPTAPDVDQRRHHHAGERAEVGRVGDALSVGLGERQAEAGERRPVAAVGRAGEAEGGEGVGSVAKFLSGRAGPRKSDWLIAPVNRTAVPGTGIPRPSTDLCGSCA